MQPTAKSHAPSIQNVVLRVSVRGKNVIKTNETTLQHTLRTKEYESKQNFTQFQVLSMVTAQMTVCWEFVYNGRRPHLLSNRTGPDNKRIME
jgi:hypothetical protein